MDARERFETLASREKLRDAAHRALNVLLDEIDGRLQRQEGEMKAIVVHPSLLSALSALSGLAYGPPAPVGGGQRVATFFNIPLIPDDEMDRHDVAFREK